MNETDARTMVLRLYVECEGDAFEYGARGHELASILEGLAAKLREDQEFPLWTNLHDMNGNACGKVRLVAEKN